MIRWSIETRRNRFIAIPRLTSQCRGGLVVLPIRVVKIAAEPVASRHKMERGLPMRSLFSINASMKNS